MDHTAQVMECLTETLDRFSEARMPTVQDVGTQDESITAPELTPLLQKQPFAFAIGPRGNCVQTRN